MKARAAILATVLAALLPCVCKPAEAQTVRIPIKRDRGWILVSATVNNRKTATFILDTGAMNTIISEGLAATIKERSGMSMRGVDGQTTSAWRVRATLQIDGTSYEEKLDAVLVTDVEKITHSGKAIDGILGMDVLGRYDRIDIDLRANTVTLTRRAS